MATLCTRSTDCLAGRAVFGAHCGVRTAAALAPRLPMQQPRQHESQALATAPPPHVALNSRSARGRANGQQQRRRRSPPAAGAGAGSPPHKRVMENVVILRRGQVLMDVATAPTSGAGTCVPQAVAEKAEAALAGKDADVAAEAYRDEREKVDESVASARQSSVEPCETAAAVDPRGAQKEAAETAVAMDNMGTEAKEEEPVVATNQSGAETTTEENEAEAAAGKTSAQVETAEPLEAVGQRGLDTHEKKAVYRGADAVKAEPAPAAHQTLPLAKEEAELAYSVASFAAVAPDPRALPIPALLLKPRGRATPAWIRVLVPDNDRAPAPTATTA